MSASNGNRSRFHRDRKRGIARRLRLREVMLALKNKPAAGADAPAAPQRRPGPALEAK